MLKSHKRFNFKSSNSHDPHCIKTSVQKNKMAHLHQPQVKLRNYHFGEVVTAVFQRCQKLSPEFFTGGVHLLVVTLLKNQRRFLRMMSRFVLVYNLCVCIMKNKKSHIQTEFTFQPASVGFLNRRR